MLDIKNTLEVVNEVVIVPIAIIAFFMLMYIAVYLKKKDPDVIRSRIFLRYDEFKKSFILLTVFAFLLVLHVLFIYIPHFLGIEEGLLIEDIQRFFGVALALTLSALYTLSLEA